MIKILLLPLLSFCPLFSKCPCQDDQDFYKNLEGLYWDAFVHKDDYYIEFSQNNPTDLEAKYLFFYHLGSCDAYQKVMMEFLLHKATSDEQ